MKDKLNLLFSYLRTRLVTILAVLITWGTCAVVYYAYNLPSEPFEYALLLGLIILLPVAIVDFVRDLHKHRILQIMKKTAEYSLSGMPYALHTVERDYQEIIQALFDGRAEIISQNDIKRRETSEYYTMWVHQIKTPIAAMRLMLQAQQDQKLTVELIQIEQYVDMALNYVRLDSIHNDLEIKLCRLDDVIGKALKKFSRIFIMNKVSLNFEPTNQTVLTDEKWLGFVLEQIISNALKYTKSGAITIETVPNKRNHLVIRDTGIGIRGEDLPRVFEKGFTGYNGRQDKKSSGIGLYMCQKVMNVLSHKITMESELGVGTAVTLDMSTVTLGVE